MTAALLLSGGIDSAALAAWKRPSLAITIDYGQAAALAEIRASKEICAALNLPQEIVRVDCSALGSGELAGQSPSMFAPSPEWWPFRNQLLITLAAMKCIGLGIDTILVGAVSSDSRHADGSQDFFDLVDRLVAIQEGKMRVTAPAASMSSSELVAVSKIPVTVLSWAHSCHRGNVACGACRGCEKHRDVMRDLGLAVY